MRERSASKVKQVMEMMKILHLRVEARERITDQGFVEKLVFWIDDEKYEQSPEVSGETGPTGETHA